MFQMGGSGQRVKQEVTLTCADCCASVFVTDCDYAAGHCAVGLRCGVDNCQDYHAGLTSTSDCCERGEVGCSCTRGLGLG